MAGAVHGAQFSVRSSCGRSAPNVWLTPASLTT
jgi:hypothetical protein